MITIERITGLAKIIFAEALMVFCLSGIVGNLVSGTGIPGCPANGSAMTPLLTLIAGVLGLISASWLVTSILAPALREDSYQPLLRMGSFRMSSPFTGPVSFPMCSTHPSYVFVDLLMAATGILLYAIIPDKSSCVFLFERARGLTAMALGVAIPILRLVSWYGLKRQVDPEVRQGAWAPVALLYGFLAFIGLLTWLISRAV